jgi:hypothetical protein
LIFDFELRIADWLDLERVRWGARAHGENLTL